MKKALAIFGLLAALSANAFFISIGGGGGGGGLTSIDNVIATNVVLQGQFAGSMNGVFTGQAYYTNASISTNFIADNTNILFTVADITTGATLNFAANVQGGLGDAGAGFFAGENIIWTNTAGMVSRFNVFSNGVFYGYPSEQPLNNGTGRSYYSINCTATATTLFYAQQPYSSISSNIFSLGFDPDGTFADLNIRYNGAVREKFSGNNWYVNDTNGNNYASADGSAFYFGDGTGGSAALVNHSGFFSGKSSGSNVLGYVNDANHATFADYADFVLYITNSINVTFATNAQTAQAANLASYATNAGTATNFSGSIQVSQVTLFTNAATGIVQSVLATNVSNVPTNVLGKLLTFSGTNLLVDLKNFTNQIRVGFGVTLTNNALVIITNAPPFFTFSIDFYEPANGVFDRFYSTNAQNQGSLKSFATVQTNTWQTDVIHFGSSQNFWVQTVTNMIP